MSKVSDKVTLSRKVGAEDILMMRIPASRVRNILSHHAPPLDEKSRCYVALLAQVCRSNSFDGHETGQTDELHFWLKIRSSETGASVRGADMMLPSTFWFSLASATSNIAARDHLQSFGFRLLGLEKINLQDHGGSLVFPDGGQIDWVISGTGRKLPHAGINHTVFVKADEPGATGHHIAALLFEPAMDQPGKVRIQTDVLEPFLFKGERFAAAIHRISRLEADIVWQKYLK